MKDIMQSFWDLLKWTLVAIIIAGSFVMLFALIDAASDANTKCQLCGYDGAHFFMGTRFCYSTDEEKNAELISLNKVLDKCINLKGEN